MKLIDKVIDFIRKPENETRNKAPEGVCPVCWGRQEYNGKIRKVFKDKQIDVNNHHEVYNVVEDFVVNKMKGIHLKEGEDSYCPNCGEPCDECENT